MPSSIVPRFDTSDPKKPEAERTFKITAPKDSFAVLSSGGGMMLGAAAMFTRIPVFAFAAFAISLSSLLNGPDVTDPNSSSSPWTSMMLSTTSLANLYMGKFVDLPVPAARAATGTA